MLLTKISKEFVLVTLDLLQDPALLGSPVAVLPSMHFFSMLPSA